MTSVPDSAVAAQRISHGNRLHRLRIARVVQETCDARSFVFEAPFAVGGYLAGQFLTFRVVVDGEERLRSYSMSSSPAVDTFAQVTVKRVPGGVVSNWMNDVLTAGDVIEATRPTGSFVPDSAGHDVVAFAGGSGITPVFSIVKTVLEAAPERRVRLLYANRDRESVIFRDQLLEMAERYGPRLSVTFHHDCDAGIVDRHTVGHMLDSAAADAEYFLCGPEPFTALTQGVLAGHGVDTGRVRSE